MELELLSPRPITIEMMDNATKYVQMETGTTGQSPSIMEQRVALSVLIAQGHRNVTEMILFKESGKYYTSEEWRIPDDAIGPYDMVRSDDFRRISGGKVLVTSVRWGFPHLL